MRSNIEFRVEGKTHKDITEQVTTLICDYLDIKDAEQAMSAVDAEIKVQQTSAGEKKYSATAHVRIK